MPGSVAETVHGRRGGGWVPSDGRSDLDRGLALVEWLDHGVPSTPSGVPLPCVAHVYGDAAAVSIVYGSRRDLAALTLVEWLGSVSERQAVARALDVVEGEAV